MLLMVPLLTDLNIASLGLHKDEMVAAISLTDLEFDIIAVSETKIIKDQVPTFDITLPGYKEYLTPTESSKGGVIIYIKDSFEVKRRKDLEIKMYTIQYDSILEALHKHEIKYSNKFINTCVHISCS